MLNRQHFDFCKTAQKKHEAKNKADKNNIKFQFTAKMT